MRNARLTLAVCLLLSFLTAQAAAEVYVNRSWVSTPDPPNYGYWVYNPVTISTNTTWTAAAGPYILQRDVSVAPGATLTIEAGTQIRIDDNYGIYVNGTLAAIGTEGSRIAFTRNGAGTWRGIYLGPGAGASTLTNCDLSYGGTYNSGYGLNITPHGSYIFGSLYIDSSNLTVSGCTISNSGTHGIALYASRANLSSNTFTNMGDGWYPIRYETTDTFGVLSGNSTSGTGHNGVGLASGALSSSGTWSLPGASFPYLMNGPVTVPEGTTLTVAAGTTVKSNFDGIYIHGTLNAVGSAPSPITFTTRSGTPAAGSWRGIYLGPTAGASVLTHVTIDYAGVYNSGYGLNVTPHGSYVFGALYVDGISPPLTNLTIRNSETNCLELYGSNSAIAGTLFQNCGRNGLRASNGSRPSVTDSTFAGDPGWYAVSLDATSVPVPGNIAFTGTVRQGVEIRGGTLTGSATWKRWNASAPYAVTGDVTVNAGVNLTVDPLVAVKLWNSGIYVNGTLTANGTNGRITFTSLADDTIAGDTNGDGAVSSAAAGNWRGIYLGPAAGASTLTNCDLSYGGTYNSGYGLNVTPHGPYVFAALYVDGISPSLTNLTIQNSETNCLELYGSNAAIGSGLFQNCGWSEISAVGGSSPVIGTSRFIGTSSSWGITNSTPAIVINARNNYWGAASGPTHASNPAGTGVKVSDGVDFSGIRQDERYRLIVNVNGVGNVYSTPAGISCGGNACSASYDYLQSVSLTAVPAWYTRVSWSGCSGYGNTCGTFMDADKSISATFNGNDNVRLNGPTPTLYSRLMDAYAAIGPPGSGTIQAQSFTFPEYLLFTGSAIVRLEGGKDPSFVQTAGMSRIKGLVVRNGRVMIRNFVIN